MKVMKISFIPKENDRNTEKMEFTRLEPFSITERSVLGYITKYFKEIIVEIVDYEGEEFKEKMEERTLGKKT